MTTCDPHSVDRRRWLRDTAIAATAAGLTTWTPGPLLAQPLPPQAAFEWPDIDLLDGTRWPAASWQHTGAVLVFWATHCPYCRRHNVHVEKLHRQLAGQPVRVLGLSSDHDPAVVRRYMQQQGLSFPVSMQSELMRSRLKLGRTIPTTLTLDRRGRRGLAIPGEMFEEDVMGLAKVAAAG
jgi:thiol-disulfide isomerase/thioredoxin